jgi:hypothetical protein
MELLRGLNAFRDLDDEATLEGLEGWAVAVNKKR